MTKISLKVSLEVKCTSEIFSGFSGDSLNLLIVWWILRKRCSENMQQIYSRTRMPKCDFNKFALQEYRWVAASEGLTFSNKHAAKKVFLSMHDLL